jgi:hypothetical protein
MVSRGIPLRLCFTCDSFLKFSIKGQLDKEREHWVRKSSMSLYTPPRTEIRHTTTVIHFLNQIQPLAVLKSCSHIGGGDSITSTDCTCNFRLLLYRALFYKFFTGSHFTLPQNGIAIRFKSWLTAASRWHRHRPARCRSTGRWIIHARRRILVRRSIHQVSGLPATGIEMNGVTLRPANL